ncbi:MAG: MBL fold metallo-hydrolase [Bacteroidales bacterium]|nr:MBL fold metallo-hydrolase [Bacteroidales bacterium]
MSNLRFMSFSSGSCGNCYYLECEGQAILIDAGTSLRSLKKHMTANGLSMDAVCGILVTHDHLDHIRNLGSYCKRLGKPVYASAPLHEALAHHSFTASCIAPCRRILDEGRWNPVGNMKVRYFVVPHDASFTCGYAVSVADRKFFIMTDAGRVTDEAVSLASQADVVVIESNYDVDMLMGGPYPHELKMRICGGNGHLSNDECASALRRIWHPGLRAVFLCHLSENNNTHEAAYAASLAALRSLSPSFTDGSMILKPLPREYPSALYTL